VEDIPVTAKSSNKQENTPLVLTDTAGAILQYSLATTPVSADEFKCFRIVPDNEQNLTVEFAKPEPGDATIKYDGAVVLAMPKALLPFFANKKLDIDAAGKLKLC
jgi:hypothetical protein